MTNDFVDAGRLVREKSQRLKQIEAQLEQNERDKDHLTEERGIVEQELEAAQARLLNEAELLQPAEAVELKEAPAPVEEASDPGEAAVCAGDAPNDEALFEDPEAEAQSLAEPIITDEGYVLQENPDGSIFLEGKQVEPDPVQKRLDEIAAHQAKRTGGGSPPEPEAGVMMQQATEELAGAAETVIDATDDVIAEPTQEQIDAVLNDDTPFPGISGEQPAEAVDDGVTSDPDLQLPPVLR